MRQLILWLLLLIGLGIGYFLFPKKETKPLPTKHQYTNVLKNVRLGDGTLLGVETYVEWKVDSVELFYEQFDSMEAYAVMLLYPRQSEICNEVTVNYDKRLFKREKNQQKIKQEIQRLLLTNLKEEGITIDTIRVQRIYRQYALKEVMALYKDYLPQEKEQKQKSKKTTTTKKSTTKPLKGLANMKQSTLLLLGKVEEELNEKLVINSGYRSKEHNKRVGGVSNSAHLRGYAVDIAIYSKAHRRKMVATLKKVGFKRIGIYATHVHADNDPSLKNAVWYD